MKIKSLRLNASKCLAFVLASLFTVGVATSSQAKDVNLPPNSNCDVNWAKVVSSVRQAAKEKSDARRIVLFAGPDGSISNCLDERVPKDIISELEFWEKQRSAVMSVDPTYQEYPPPSFCGTGISRQKGFLIMTIHLPLNEDELSSDVCKLRLQGISERVRVFIQGM